MHELSEAQAINNHSSNVFIHPYKSSEQDNNSQYGVDEYNKKKVHKKRREVSYYFFLFCICLYRKCLSVKN